MAVEYATTARMGVEYATTVPAAVQARGTFAGLAASPL